MPKKKAAAALVDTTANAQIDTSLYPELHIPDEVKDHYADAWARVNGSGVSGYPGENPFWPMQVRGHVRSVLRDLGADEKTLEDDARELADAIISDQMRSMRLHLHFSAISMARVARENNARRAESDRQWRLAYTCPVCREIDPKRNGRVYTADVATLRGQYEALLPLTACGTCHEVARADYVARRGTERGSDGQLRIEAVRAALS